MEITYVVDSLVHARVRASSATLPTRFSCNLPFAYQEPLCISMATDQDVARQLFAEGAALVLLDVPERTEFGIDYNCWNVGPKFKGVKMIPPGFHFVFYR